MTVLHMDCVAGMRAFADATFDSIVCDPPYELTNGKKGGTGQASVNTNSPAGRARISTGGFMGQHWDATGIAHSVEMWAECLRVLKPGGHLLAFSGSRTYHRMTCAIEDAGFEIRDQIMWLYSTGFPKSHNMDNHRGIKTCGCMVQSGHDIKTNAGTEKSASSETARIKSDTEYDLRSMRDADIPPAVDDAIERGEILHSGMSQQGAPVTGRAQFPAAEIGGIESRVERRGDASSSSRELRAGSLYARAGMGETDGEAGRLHHGTSASNGDDVRVPADADGMRTSHRSRPAKQRADQHRIVAGQSESQISGAWPICGRCDKPILPSGLGTALKPAHEPICVARKPLACGTVAANVLAYGTGAINIDASRIGSDVITTHKTAMLAHGGENARPWHIDHEATKSEHVGRWPANVIHDGSDDVLDAFDGPDRRDGSPGRRVADQSPARFFYAAKASKADRDEGNIHPTVKPTDLMRYLCRLVTPPGGIILDPFAGSGSTGKAAKLEGFMFIGFEQDEHYAAIANARIERAA